MTTMPGRTCYLTLQQASAYSDDAKRLTLARLFVTGALKNIEKVLMYYARRDPKKDVEDILRDIRSSISQVDEQHDISTLMALEGNARQRYYQAWDEILADDDFKFESRTKRPPQNRLNALISFGNSMVYVACLSEIYQTRLDPRIGFLHATNYRRYSLNLDLAEIFKPIIVDRTIFTLVNKKMLTASSFKRDAGGILLTDKGRQVFVKAYDERLKSTLKIPRLGRHVSYKRLIRMECYKLEKHLLEDEPYAPYVARW